MSEQPPGWFVSIFVWLFSIGEIWVFAWMLNPSINSNTVWFISFIFAALCSYMESLRRDR